MRTKNNLDFKSKNGELITKLSYLIMGFSNLCYKQIFKGILFLVVEISFIAYMITYGFQSLMGIITLGTKAQGWVMDKDLGINVQVQGDNSMLLMIYGLSTLIICILFFICYIISIKSARHLQKLKEEGKLIPTLKDELKSYLDEKFHITLLSIPFLLVLLFTIIPLIYMILLAFTSYDHNHMPPKSLFRWIGLSNFGEIFNGNISGTFFPLLSWTIIWAIFATATSFFFGVVISLLINKKGIRFKKFWRTIFVLTIAVPQFVSLLIMRNLLHVSGPLNAVLQQIGLINKPIGFLTDSFLAKVSVITVNMWVGIPVTMLVTTAILMNLPEDQFEAAKIDGANDFQLFKNITLPQIIFIMTPSLIQQFIANINNFNVIYLLTEGNPFNSNYYGAGDTDLLVTWLYKLTVNKADYNLASAIGIIIFIICAVFSLLMYTRSASYKKEDNLQ